MDNVNTLYGHCIYSVRLDGTWMAGLVGLLRVAGVIYHRGDIHPALVGELLQD